MVYRLCLQMVRLYKDPEGDNVFSGREDPGQVTAVLSPTGVQSQIGEKDIDRLNKKIGQMENIIAEYMVCHVMLSSFWMPLIAQCSSENYRDGPDKEVDVNVK